MTRGRRPGPGRRERRGEQTREESGRRVNKLIGFIKEAREELKRVNWPTRQELVESTKVVIVASILLAVFIGVLDFILTKAIKLFIG